VVILHIQVWFAGLGSCLSADRWRYGRYPVAGDSGKDVLNLPSLAFIALPAFSITILRIKTCGETAG